MLVVICILLFLSIVVLFLVRCKNVLSCVKFIKSNKRIKGLRLVGLKLFCSNKSLSFNLYQTLMQGLFVFDNLQKYTQVVNSFKNSGLDIFLPVYKYEFYDFNLEKFFNFAKVVKCLDNKGVSFNFLVFFNNNKKYKPLTKIIKYFKFKNVVVRVYHCCEVDYNLLSAINIVDLNQENDVVAKYLKSTREDSKQSKKILLRRYNKTLPITQKFSGCFLQRGEQTFYFDKFSYMSYCLSSMLSQKDFEATLTKTYDYENQVELYKLTIKNYLSAVQTFYCCFGTIFDEFIDKNCIYTIMQSKNKTCVLGTDESKNINILGDFKNKFCYKNYFYVSKKLKVEPFKSCTFYFGFCKKDKFVDNNLLLNLSASFESNNLKYNKIKTPKVLSKNKVLNYLINNFLPQKIIEQTILKSKNLPDFEYLVNKTFNNKLIDKDVFKNNLNGYFLVSNNLFKIYFNLLYFGFGVWQDSKGLVVNPDKTFVEDNCVISCYNLNKTYNINLKNKNLQGEIEVNNIKFTNLSFISFENKKENIYLHF